MDKEALETNALSKSMAQTIGFETSSILGDFVEVGIDAFLDSGILDDIPIISTVRSMYRIGKSVHELHHLRQFSVFISEFDTMANKHEAREAYKKYFDEGERDEELEYLTIILDRYMEQQQALWLARLYAAMLDGKLTFSELRMYSQALERLLPGDYEMLRDNVEASTVRTTESAALLRLVGLGLMIEVPKQHGPTFKGEVMSFDNSAELAEEERGYRRTEFGDRLVGLLEDE